MNNQLDGKVEGLTLSEDGKYLAIALVNGFAVFQCHPLRLVYRSGKVVSISIDCNLVDPSFSESQECGTVRRVGMLRNTNVFGLLLDQSQTANGGTTLTIWDADKSVSICQVKSGNNILGVWLRSNLIILLLFNRIYVLSLEADPKILSLFRTYQNDAGLLAISSQNANGSCKIAFPSGQAGVLQICQVTAGQNAESAKAPLIIKACNSAVAQMCMNADGTKLATASVKVSNGSRSLVRPTRTNLGVKGNCYPRFLHARWLPCRFDPALQTRHRLLPHL